MDEVALKLEINLHNVTKKIDKGLFHKETVILQSISDQIFINESVGLIGHNGSGKTTLIKAVLGFFKLSSGQIQRSRFKTIKDFKKKLGYLPERPYFHLFLTGQEFLDFHLSLYQVKDENKMRQIKNKITELVNVFNLSQALDKKLELYSKGMLQKLGLIQALMTEPDILILDEPMSGLDEASRLNVKNELLKVKNKCTLIIATHQSQDLQELCDRVLLLEKGQCVYKGPFRGFNVKVLNEDQ